MIEFRGWQTQRAVKEQLAGRGSEEVRAADDFGDPHCGIIHNDGELIGRDAVVAPDYEISEIFPSHKSLRAEMAIEERDGLAVRDAKAPVVAKGRGSRGEGRSGPA